MAMYRKQNGLKKSKTPRLLVIVAVSLLLLTCIFVALERFGITNFVNNPKSATQKTSDKAKTTSNQPSAQSNFTSDSASNTKKLASTIENEGTVADTNGTVISNTNASQYIKSNGGVIIVHEPLTNSQLKKGSQLVGESTADEVSFRLIDNITGVIAQGNLKVVSGKFSGTFDFSTTATEGRLDLFTATPDGVESNNIYIPVRFTQ